MGVWRQQCYVSIAGRRVTTRSVGLGRKSEHGRRNWRSAHGHGDINARVWRQQCLMSIVTEISMQKVTEAVYVSIAEQKITTGIWRAVM
jgi:hypothetical protein